MKAVFPCPLHLLAPPPEDRSDAAPSQPVYWIPVGRMHKMTISTLFRAAYRRACPLPHLSGRRAGDRAIAIGVAAKHGQKAYYPFSLQLSAAGA